MSAERGTEAWGYEQLNAHARKEVVERLARLIYVDLVVASLAPDEVIAKRAFEAAEVYVKFSEQMK